jgi:hypothetical protein
MQNVIDVNALLWCVNAAHGRVRHVQGDRHMHLRGSSHMHVQGDDEVHMQRDGMHVQGDDDVQVQEGQGIVRSTNAISALHGYKSVSFSPECAGSHAPNRILKYCMQCALMRIIFTL